MSKATTVSVTGKASVQKVKKAETKPIKKEKQATINLKYTDKSPGQPGMVVVFEAIRKLVLPYNGKSGMTLHGGKDGQLNLVSHKPVTIAGRDRAELWFVSVLVQKGYVGFYFMPIYMHDEMKKQFTPAFIKCLKGKACFHIKNTDPAIMADIRKALKVGYEAYKERGWL